MPIPAPNTQPVFIKTPFLWSTRLTNQVAPSLITTQTPVLLGTSGINGGIIESIYGVQYTGAGTGTLHIYGRDDDLVYRLLIPPVSLSTNPTKVTLPDVISPAKTGVAGNYTALRLPPEYSIYVAVLATITGDGWEIHAVGGDY